ncbi:MAG: 2'-5' RNA ligase family protein [Calditrichia bacterium]
MPHTNISHWQDWQLDYRFGVILILPPDDLAKPINELRAAYDPQSAAICPAHISVSDPLQEEMTDSFRKEIVIILQNIEPFELHYDKPQASTKRAGVAYPITPQKPIDELKKALHRAKIFGDDEFQRGHIPAHMTIAEFISIEDSLRICAELHDTAPSGSFLCDRLELMIPDERFCFQRQETFYLGSIR